jgi:hypothetical protein
MELAFVRRVLDAGVDNYPGRLTRTKQASPLVLTCGRLGDRAPSSVARTLTCFAAAWSDSQSDRIDVTSNPISERATVGARDLIALALCSRLAEVQGLVFPFVAARSLPLYGLQVEVR